MRSKLNSYIILACLISLIATIGYTATGTPSTLIVKTDANNNLLVAAGTQVNPITQGVFSNRRLSTDANGNLLVVPGSGSGGFACDDAFVVNVMCHGATGDGRYVIDAVTTSKSTTVTSATANFDSDRDTGKLVWGAKRIGGDSGSTLSVPLGTIVSVTNSTTIVVSIASVATNTGVWLVWGTDDTDSLQTAFALAFNSDSQLKPNIYFPSGIYIIDELLGDWRSSEYIPAILGSGSSATTIIYKSDYDLSTTFSGSGMLIGTNGATTAARIYIEGIHITGASYQFGATLKPAIVLDSGRSVVRDIEIDHVQSASDVHSGISLNGCGSTDRTQPCLVENYYVHSVAGFGLYVYNSGAILRNIDFNEAELMEITFSSSAILEGGNFDDHFTSGGDAGVSLLISGGAKAILYGTRLRHKLKIADNGTSVKCDSCIIGPVEVSNNSAVLVNANTEFRYTNTSLTSWGTGVWLANSGIAYDLGGNIYTAGSGSGGFGTKAPYNSSVATTTTLLPTCSAGFEGYKNPVSDSDTVTWGDTFSGGDTNNILAYCNGTDWTVMGK